MLTRLVYFARETWVSLWRNKLMTIAGILTVAVSLCVLGGALLMTRLVDHGTQQWKDGVEFELFMQVTATASETSAVRTALAGDPDVEHFKFLSHEDALNEYQRLFGAEDPEVVQSITAADLPESFRVAPRKAEITKSVAARYTAMPGVHSVETADKAVKNLLSITRVVRLVFLAIFFALLFASLFLIVNTIRLATYARRREIEVMKLVGASNWFVRIPFMLEGLIQGAFGALFGVVAVFALARMADQIPNDATWRGWYLSGGDAFQISLMVLVLGAGIGVIGAIVGLRRFLDV